MPTVHPILAPSHIKPSYHASESFITHKYKYLHNNSNQYIEYHHSQRICETFTPSATTSNTYAPLKKLTHRPYFESLASSSASPTKMYGDCIPVNNTAQAPNDWYGSPKKPYVAKLGNCYSSMVYLSVINF